MEYSVYELLFFMICHAFLGWCMEVVYMAVRTGRFCNRGFFNMPLSLSYGISMDLLILVIPSLEGACVLQFVAFVVIVSAGAQLADEMSVRVTGKRLWKNEAHSIYAGRKLGILYTLIMSAAALAVLLLVQPVLYICCQMLPEFLMKMLVLVTLALLAADLLVMVYTMRKRPLRYGMQNLSDELQEKKRTIGGWIAARVWQRLTKAYPDLKPADEEEQIRYVFARGLCLESYGYFSSALWAET